MRTTSLIILYLSMSSRVLYVGGGGNSVTLRRSRSMLERIYRSIHVTITHDQEHHKQNVFNIVDNQVSFNCWVIHSMYPGILRHDKYPL